MDSTKNNLDKDITSVDKGCNEEGRRCRGTSYPKETKRMPTLVLTADTHLPKRARDLPAELWRAIEEADVVVHAGDWVEPALLDRPLVPGADRRGAGPDALQDRLGVGCPDPDEEDVGQPVLTLAVADGPVLLG